MSLLDYRLVPVTAFAQNCSILICRKTSECAMIDPGGDALRIIEQVDALAGKPTKILLTHGHLDHVGAAAELANQLNIPIIGPHRADEFWLQALPEQSEMFGFPNCEPLSPDQWLDEGEQVMIGEICLQILHCPGHTPGHIVFYQPESALLISGDVIFNQGVGRSDFPQGDHQQLIHSIKTKLLPLGDDVTFIPGHGPQSTLGAERKNNPFLR